jgi:hypothetical protein
MFLRLAYAHVGAGAVLDPDPYDLTGLLEGYDNDLHRKGTKKGFNSLLHGGRAGAPDVLKRLPAGTKAYQFREAMKAKHPPIAQFLNGDPDKAIGMDLMFQESKILLRCLNQLMAQGIVALPLHDGILVAQRHAEKGEKAMRVASREEVGVELEVAVKEAIG